MSLCVYHCDLICSGKTTYEKVSFFLNVLNNKIKNLEEGDTPNGLQRLKYTVFPPPRHSLFDLRREVEGMESTESDPLLRHEELELSTT